MMVLRALIYFLRMIVLDLSSIFRYFALVVVPALWRRSQAHSALGDNSRALQVRMFLDTTVSTRASCMYSCLQTHSLAHLQVCMCTCEHFSNIYLHVRMHGTTHLSQDLQSCLRANPPKSSKEKFLRRIKVRSHR